MKIINQSHEILTDIDVIEDIVYAIEVAGRTCYKSEDKITYDSADKFCRMLIKKGHHAMIEHGSITVKFITDRGVTHELVRHRIASFAQESTRYVKYDGDTEFIRPVFDWAQEKAPPSRKYSTWINAMSGAELNYQDMIKEGCSPQEARSVLPNSLKTEIIVTANVREWRHIFDLRTSPAAHPQIRRLMIPLLRELRKIAPPLFDDLEAGFPPLYGESK